MDTAVIIFIIFAFSIGLLIYKYERPAKKGEKLTGRGGDFAE
jgi:hypothetical protein